MALRGVLDWGHGPRARARHHTAPSAELELVPPPVEAVAGARRLAGIEGLRGLAALGVLTWHVWAHPVSNGHYGVSIGPLTKVADNGRTGVTMFFILSGFLLYRPFAAAIARGRPRPSTKSYFRNRVLRILPAYWAILLIVAFAFQQSLLTKPLQLLANMLFLQSYIVSYVPTAFHGLGIAPAWSLCVEVVFYLVLPLLAFAGWLVASSGVLAASRAVLVPPAIMLAGGLAAIVATRMIRFGNLWRQGFPIHAHWFGVGMLIAVLRVRWEDGARQPSALTRRLAAVAAVAIGLAAVKLMYMETLSFEEGQSLLAVSCGVLLAIVVLPGRQGILVRFLQSRPLYALGLLSYSIFLWHDPLLRVLRGHGLTSNSTFGFIATYFLVLGLTLAASTLTYRFVERPALALKARRTARSEPRAEAGWASAAP